MGGGGKKEIVTKTDKRINRQTVNQKVEETEN